MTKATLALAVALGVIMGSTSISAVDIGNFEDLVCAPEELLVGCYDQPERVCCGFPQRATSTWAVGFQGLGEGDIATWFHEGPTLANGAINHCGGTRRSQVMMGDTAGEICMSVGDDDARESNDGANW